jgi:NAD(P) transhydrogenase
MDQFDVIVVGSGPGGEGAAMQAAKSGKRVLVVERHHQVGGGCTHWGTIPSKALRHSVQRLMEARSSPLFAHVAPPADLEFPRLLGLASGVISRQVKMRSDFYERNAVRVVQGVGTFVDAHCIEVRDAHGLLERFAAEAMVIATGSHPYRPAEVDFSHPRIRDCDTILSLESTPRSITIYGAGVIGCEYASIFRGLGCKVNLVNQRRALLEHLDAEITDALGYHLRDQGVVIRHDETWARVLPEQDAVVLELTSGKKLRADVLLWANGRSGNSQTLGLAHLGLQADHRGHIPVNDDFQTQVSTVYAVGDIIGPPGLASASYDQGRAAMLHLLTGRSAHRHAHLVPSGIYTSPEISCVGRTERELTEARIPYEVGHALFRSLARAQITGQTTGMLKILFHRDSLEVLGIHCFGDQASEIVHIGQAIMAQPGSGNSLRYFVDATFNYPTMAEAYRVAALNGMNRLF